MNEELTNVISQLKGLLNKYPDKTLEILQYVFGKDIILKIINKPTYEDLQQENQQLEQALLNIKEYIETECSKEYCTNSRLYITDGLKKDLIFKINKALGSDGNE